MDRTSIINDLIVKFGYQSYLEIGLGPVSNFGQIKAKHKIGVDPNPACKLSPNVITLTSDEFFSTCRTTFDIIFIDGLHLRNQVLTDVTNALNALNPNGTLVLHDVNPPTEQHAGPVYVPGTDWNGTVWQAWAVLRMSRPDLEMYVHDVDWGVGIIRHGSQKVFDLPYSFWDQHRKELLNAR